MSPTCSLGFSCLSPAWKRVLFGHIINPLTIKPVYQNGWILASLCQYPATLTSRLVSKTYILLFCWNKNPQALKFKLKSLNFIMLYKQDNSGKKIYRRKLYSGKFTKWNNFKSGRSNLAIAVRRKSPTFCGTTNSLLVKWRLRNEHKNSILMTRHFPDLVSTFDWLKICFIQSEALSRSGWWRIITIEFLCLFLRRHFMGKPVCGSRNVCCFPMPIANLAILTKKKQKQKQKQKQKKHISIFAIFAISCHNLCLFNGGTHTRIHLLNNFVDQFNIYWYHMTKNILPFYFND